jgi:predicted  nucleic acid-binding Zn-ribbon protein
MAKNHKEVSYWPHMILGFLIVGITLSYWTVKSASSIPVQESNAFMMKYQQADMKINEILRKKERFDAQYRIEMVDTPTAMVEIEHAKRAKAERAVVLHSGGNTFYYHVVDRTGHLSTDANVSFLLTRPHTKSEDHLVENVPVKDGKYVIENIEVVKPGRYTLRLKAVIDDNTVGYSNTPAYLKP